MSSDKIGNRSLTADCNLKFHGKQQSTLMAQGILSLQQNPFGAGLRLVSERVKMQILLKEKQRTAFGVCCCVCSVSRANLMLLFQVGKTGNGQRLSHCQQFSSKIQALNITLFSQSSTFNFLLFLSAWQIFTTLTPFPSGGGASPSQAPNPCSLCTMSLLDNTFSSSQKLPFYTETLLENLKAPERDGERRRQISCMSPLFISCCAHRDKGASHRISAEET